MAVPGDGIYAAWAHIADGEAEPSKPRMAAVSIGTRPTFDAGDRTVEAFVLDFDGDLYGRDIRLEFVERLRDEEKYDSVEALLEQIDLDVARTRGILGQARDTARLLTQRPHRRSADRVAHVSGTMATIGGPSW